MISTIFFFGPVLGYAKEEADKIKKELGFDTKHTVKEAIGELKQAFEQGKLPLPDDDRYFNVKMVKKIIVSCTGLKI